MNYQQLVIKTDSLNANFIEEVALALGALSVDYSDTFDNPILEPNYGETPLWDDITIKILFSEDIDKIFILQQISNICNLDGEFEFIADKNWQQECNKNFTLTKYGDCLWVCPSWEEAKNLNGEVIHMDPGMAFGTGAHQTTSLCLEYLANNRPINKNLLDFGCGSGILAIASKKLGAKDVVAIDNDIQAISATKENSKHNNINLIIKHSSDFKPKQFDIVIANILTNTLVELIDLLTRCVKTQGKIIMSGILQEQEQYIVQHYSRYFTNFKIINKDEWLLITADKI